ncbi:hypothetical protein ACQ4PT_020419 [Festuca glaucescens]
MRAEKPAGAASGPGWRAPGHQKKRRRHDPLPLFTVPPGVPADLAELCFNCAEPGHVAANCTGKNKCLRCKGPDHVTRQCTAPPAPKEPPPPVQLRGGPRVESASAREQLGGREAAPPSAARVTPAHEHLGARGGLQRQEQQEAACHPQQAMAPAAQQGHGHLPVRERLDFRNQGVDVPSSDGRRGGTRVVPEEARVAGFQAACPAAERCIIYRSPGVERAEQALRWSLVAYVSGTRRQMGCGAVAEAIVQRFPSLAGHLSAHRFWPAELLVVFDSQAHRDEVYDAVPLDASEFSLRFSPWNRQLQATRRVFRYRVHLEVVGVPATAWNMDTAKTILGSSSWVERLGTETASRADMGNFQITAWTDDPGLIPRVKELWLAEPLEFGDEDDDLLLPVEALIPEEVALLQYDDVIHVVRIEDKAVSAVRSAPAPPERDDGYRDDCGGELGRGATLAGSGDKVAFSPKSNHKAAGSGDRLLVEQPMFEPTEGTEAYGGWRLASSEREDSRHRSSSSVQIPKARTLGVEGSVMWSDSEHDPDVAASPTGSLGSNLSWTSPLDSMSGPRWGRELAGLSYFTVELTPVSQEECSMPLAVVPSVGPPAVAPTQVVSRGLGQAGTTAHDPGSSHLTPSASTDIDLKLVTFRERCWLKKAALLPRPAPRKPMKKRVPPSVVRQSSRVAGRFALGTPTPIKRQQKLLMIQLGIAREGEHIGDEALQAYIDYFDKKPMTEEDLAACLALFGWLPATMPLAREVDGDVLV